MIKDPKPLDECGTYAELKESVEIRKAYWEANMNEPGGERYLEYWKGFARCMELMSKEIPSGSAHMS